MKIQRFTFYASAAILLLGLASSASAQTAEICGNGLDDDANGLQDDGCYPTLTTGVCESPLSCGETGMISPSTGSLRYSLPPDIAPSVPWGPGIGLRRFYTSKFDPGASPPAWKKSLGDRWQHTYSSWITVGSGSTPTISWHTPQGQDVQFTPGSPWGALEYHYVPQTGVHVKSAAMDEFWGWFTVTLLTGERLVYTAADGRLRGIYDAAGKMVSLGYDINSQVSRVTDAQGNRQLLFGYTGSVLTSVAFQIKISSVWTTQHTTSYGYTSGALTSVTIGSLLAQQNSYTSGYLTQIQDAAGKSIVSFVYDSAVAGKVVRADTRSGMVGFELSSSRATCSGKTVVYFNRGNTTSCNVDGDCGSGFLCGGKTGSGTTGVCFRAARCLTLSSPSEDIVTTVTPLGPPGESCDGACTDVAQYIWNTTGVLDLKATQDPAGNHITRTFNSNGVPTTITYGDPDSDPTNANSAREVYLLYDTAFPGRVSEIRRKSELRPSLPCTPSEGDACQITTMNWGTNGKLASVTEYGSTLSSTGSTTTYSYTTSYSYDANGRITQIDGPLVGSNDVTVFEYWSSTDPLKDGFLQNLKRKRDASTFVTSSALAYDFWGHPIALQGADTDASNSTGTLTCLTFDLNRGVLTERREAMAGQTDCSTVNGSDISTGYTRDTALRLTRLTRPDGSCLLYEYDSKGRLQRTKRRDDCNAASAGDRQEYIYDTEGLVTEIQTYDASNVLTAKQPYTYFDSRKLQKIMNPVDTSKWTGLTYDDRGLISQIDGAGSLGKTVFNRDGLPGRDGRVTSEQHYKDASAFDTWNLLYDWTGNQLRVTDGDSKATETTRDDLGRVVKLVSPDMTYPTLYLYDGANRLTSMAEAFGGGAAQWHNFTYDNLGRLLTAEYDGRCPTGSSHTEVIQQFDAPATCPSGMICGRTGGRLAYVKVTLMCSATYADGALDQETWFSYDDAGRLVREYIQDDSGRVADHLYGWTKNGALAQVTTPSGVVMGRTYGSAGSNADTERVTALWQTNTSTPVIDNVVWFPYGPLKQYNQKNLISNKLQRTAIARNLAYRTTSIAVENQTNGADTFSVTIGEDAKGRVTKRDYTGGATGVQDSYFLYDNQDRVLCETNNLVSSCPTSGSNIKNSRTTPFFTNAGDWNQLLRPVPGSAGGMMNSFNPSGYGTSHQITMVRQNDGSSPIGDTVLAYDARGNRTSDDNTSTLTNDRRDYTYDARSNVINVHGKYFTGGVWHDYDVASAFDAKNRRVFKSFIDNTTLVQAQWFFYYDPMDRLVEVRYTPNALSPSTYSLFQLFWLSDRLTLYWQTDYPSVTTTRRYVGTDETGRPLDMWTWPSSGNGSRVWAVNPSAWGFDTNVVGATVYQQLMFAGQYSDPETAALENSGSPIHRPGLVLNGARTYDPFTASYLQVDPLVNETRSAYGYAGGNAVGVSDPAGLAICEGPEACTSGDTGQPAGYNLPEVCSLRCEIACATALIPALGCDCPTCAPPGGYKPGLSQCYELCANFDSGVPESYGCHCTQDDSDDTDHNQGNLVDDTISPDWVRRRDKICEAGMAAAFGFVVSGIGVAISSPTCKAKGCVNQRGARIAGAIVGGVVGTLFGPDLCHKYTPTCESPFTLSSGAQCGDLGEVGPSGVFSASSTRYCCTL